MCEDIRKLTVLGLLQILDCRYGKAHKTPWTAAARCHSRSGDKKRSSQQHTAPVPLSCSWLVNRPSHSLVAPNPCSIVITTLTTTCGLPRRSINVHLWSIQVNECPQVVLLVNRYWTKEFLPTDVRRPHSWLGKNLWFWAS